MEFNLSKGRLLSLMRRLCLNNSQAAKIFRAINKLQDDILEYNENDYDQERKRRERHPRRTCAKLYATCPRGHLPYVGAYSLLKECPVQGCGIPRQSAKCFFGGIEIALASMLLDEKCAKRLRTGPGVDPDDNTIDSFTKVR